MLVSSRRVRLDARTSRSSRSSSSGGPAGPEPLPRHCATVMTSGPIAATIGACRCGAVRTAGHPRPRRPGAGSATDPAPPARPAGTSVPRSRPSSATAGWIGSAGRCAATRSGPAGRPRRRSPSRPRTPCRRPHPVRARPRRRSNPCSTARVRRGALRRHDRLAADEPVGRPADRARRGRGRNDRRSGSPVDASPDGDRDRPARPSRAGACGVRPTPDRR